MKTTKILCALVIGMMLVSSVPLFATAQTTNDTLVIALQADMLDVCPWNPDTNSVWKSNQIGWAYESLMTYNPDFELYPVLAAEKADGPNGADVTITNNGLNISVKLREDVTFSDGTPMTSKDVVFCYQTLGWGLFQTQILDALYWDDGTLFTKYDGTADGTRIGVETNGTYRVNFYLTQPYAMFWYSTMGLPINPWHVWKDHTQAVGAFGGYNTSLETGWDYGYGSETDELDAAMGTGPFYLESWVKEQGSVMKINDDYWGKDRTTTWKDVEYPSFPRHVRTIRFQIYSQLDVAILALQRGDVHHLPWSLTPGYYNQLKTDPNIGIEMPKDQGFFYLTFNQRHGAMADVDFRRAVSYAVDKDYIVNRLMGGYGVKGDVPISITNSLYVNTTVPDWIQGGNLQKAEDLLDTAGYTDQNGDGWRQRPDGSPLKYTILTPPKDYDPIRADSGIMIEKNLKSIGLDITAVPTSFDTIVSAGFVSLDFDMFILGWSVGSFPENYLKDFFHSSADVAVNPAGSNSGGYSNATVDQMIDDMAVEMNTDTRVQLIKDICGSVMEDVAYNVLYYRTNIEAYRKDIWTGWIPAFGSIYNGFSIANMAPPGTTPGGGDEGGGGGGEDYDPGFSGGDSEDRIAFDGELPIYAEMSMPDKVATDSEFTVTVMVNEMFENATSGVLDTFACEGANVEFQSSIGQFANVTTDADGKATFTVQVDWAEYGKILVSANATKGDFWAFETGSIDVIFIPHIAKLSLSTTRAVIEPEDTTDVKAIVTDIHGNPISGVNVSVDENLMFGSVDVEYKNTDANGSAVFIYTAPPASMLPNTNRYDQFKASISVTKTIIPEIQEASLIIGISNDARNWHSIDITGVTSYVISGNATGTLPLTTDVTVTVLDETGTPVDASGITIVVDDTVVTADALEKNTDVAGQVTFTLTAVDLGNVTQSTMVRVYNFTRAYATEDTFLLCNANETNTTTAYAADIDFDAMLGHQDSATITATVWDQTGAPAVGVPVQFFIPLTPEGAAARFDDGDSWGWYEYHGYPWAPPDGNWDLGWWAGYIGSWYENNATVTDANGQLIANITTSSFIADSIIPLEFGIGGYGVTEGFNFTANQFWMEDYGEDPEDGNWEEPMTDGGDGNYYWRPADHTIYDAGILWRAPMAALAKVEADRPIMSLDDPECIISMTFHDLEGTLHTSTVNIARDTTEPLNIFEVATNSKGVVQWGYDDTKYGYRYIRDPDDRFDKDRLEPGIRDYNAGIGFTATVTDPGYSRYPFTFHMPYVVRGNVAKDLILSASTSTPAVIFGDKITVEATVTDEFGNLMDNATVNVGGVMLLTDADGHVEAELDVPQAEGLQALPVVATKSGYASSYQTIYYQNHDTELYLMVEYWNLTGPAEAPLVNQTFDITFTALNNGTVDGWTTFEFLFDDAMVDSMWVMLEAGQEKNMKFTTHLEDYEFHNLTVRQMNRGALVPWTLMASEPVPEAVAELSLGDYTVPTNITQGVEFTITVVANNVGNAAGTFQIPFVIDGVTYYKVVDIAANASATVEFKWTFAEAGTFTICGVSRSVEAAEVAEPEDSDGYGMGMLAGLAIIMLVVGLIVGLLVGKMMGGGAAAAPPEEDIPPEPPVEEATDGEATLDPLPEEPPLEETPIEESPEEIKPEE